MFFSLSSTRSPLALLDMLPRCAEVQCTFILSTVLTSLMVVEFNDTPSSVECETKTLLTHGSHRLPAGCERVLPMPLTRRSTTFPPFLCVSSKHRVKVK